MVPHLVQCTGMLLSLNGVGTISIKLVLFPWELGTTIHKVAASSPLILWGMGIWWLVVGGGLPPRPPPPPALLLPVPLLACHLEGGADGCGALLGSSSHHSYMATG